MSDVLQVRNISKHFGGNIAVANVSFEIKSGTVTALIGPNGAGKTTLFNLITNLVSATEGEVFFLGRPISGMSIEAVASMGIIRTFQTARVFPGMTVLENVSTGAHRLMRAHPGMQMLAAPSARQEEQEVRSRADALLEIVGLSAYRDQVAAELPMGAQKLLELIRALMASPQLLLLDEPAAGLNDMETIELAGTLSAIRESGVTIMVIEHNMALVMGVADQVVVLDAGRTVAVGPPSEIQRSREVIDAYIGSNE